jgi:hypothetical protein
VTPPIFNVVPFDEVAVGFTDRADHFRPSRRHKPELNLRELVMKACAVAAARSATLRGGLV